jgi:hypothetical protein
MGLTLGSRYPGTDVPESPNRAEHRLESINLAELHGRIRPHDGSIEQILKKQPLMLTQALWMRGCRSSVTYTTFHSNSDVSRWQMAGAGGRPLRDCERSRGCDARATPGRPICAGPWPSVEGRRRGRVNAGPIDASMEARDRSRTGSKVPSMLPGTDTSSCFESAADEG